MEWKKREQGEEERIYTQRTSSLNRIITGKNRTLKITNGKVEILPGDPTSNRLIVPKSIDLNVKNSESVVNLSCSARRGGVGTFLMIPTIKPIFNKLHLSYNLKRANEVKFPIMVAIEGIVNGQLTEIATLIKKGAKGIYIHSDEPLNLIERVFQYGELLQVPVFVECINRAWNYGVMHEGESAYKLGVSGIPRYSESVEVVKVLELARHFDLDVVIMNITTKESVQLLENRPTRVWVEVAIDNLYFSDQYLEGFNTLMKTYPPLREEEDRQALLEGVRKGIISFISSNHISALAKTLPLEEAEPGISKLDIFSQLVYSLPIEWEILERVVALNPAKLMGLEWELGIDNFLLLEEGTFPVEGERFCSRAKITPYQFLHYRLIEEG